MQVLKYTKAIIIVSIVMAAYAILMQVNGKFGQGVVLGLQGICTFFLGVLLLVRIERQIQLPRPGIIP